jgi:hypothetical protein
MFGAIEHQMLEQMGKAGLAGRLMLRADIIPDRDSDDRRLAIGMNDDAQAVFQRELGIGDVDLADERGGGHLRGSPVTGVGQKARAKTQNNAVRDRKEGIKRLSTETAEASIRISATVATCFARG